MAIIKTTKDTFLHFTYKEYAEEIKKSKILMKNPPGIEKRGIDAVTAVSLTYGMYVPGVQITGLLEKSRRNNRPLVAIIFKTNTVPVDGHVEEIIWHEDVKITAIKIINYKQGINILKHINSQIDVDELIHYY